VGGTKGGRWEAIPFCIVPEQGQVPEYVSHSPLKQTWRVLQQDESRSKNTEKPRHFRPEPTRIGGAESPAGGTGGLAGESGANNLNGIEFPSRKLSDVFIAFDQRPMLRQHAPTPFLDLNLKKAFPAGAHEPQIQAAYSTAQRTESRSIHWQPARRI
jgi:hypothetical protein